VRSCGFNAGTTDGRADGVQEMTDRAEFREERKLKLDYGKTVISLGSVVAIVLGGIPMEPLK